MIEVEKKFILKEGDEQKLIAGAIFIGEKKFTDAYIDDAQYSITSKDMWFRNRDGVYELKVPLNESLENRISDQYRELDTEDEIAKYLHLNMSIPFDEALREKGLAPFCSIITHRRKYKKDGFIIDIDFADFGYDIAEIELMVNDISDVRHATEKIVAYAQGLGLTLGVVRGKVLEYIRRNNPEHFQALVDAKVCNR